MTRYTGLKPNRSQSAWKRGTNRALRVVISRGLDHRSSPSVSIVMMKAVLSMARAARGKRAGAGRTAMQDLVECGEIGAEHLVLAVLPRHQRAAPAARRLQGGRTLEQIIHRIRQPLRRMNGDAQTLTRDDAVRIDHSYDRHTADPGLKVRIRESFDIRGVDQDPGAPIDVVRLAVGQTAVNTDVRIRLRRALDVPIESFLAGQRASHHVDAGLRQLRCQLEQAIGPLHAPDIADPHPADVARGHPPSPPTPN